MVSRDRLVPQLLRLPMFGSSGIEAECLMIALPNSDINPV
jgi:hypothetical protein